MKYYVSIKGNIYEVCVIAQKSGQEITIKEEAGTEAVYIA